MDDFLPVAHTCFFTLDLPEYSCFEILKEKLSYAINNCIAIDADNTTVARNALGQAARRPWMTTTRT